jgi:hypothetical protein
MTGMISLVGSSSFFWLCVLLTPPVSLALDILVSAYRIIWHPYDSDYQRLKESKYRPLLDGSSLLDCVRRNSKTNARSTPPSGVNIEMNPSSFAFSQEEPGPVREGLKTATRRAKRS